MSSAGPHSDFLNSLADKLGLARWSTHRAEPLTPSVAHAVAMLLMLAIRGDSSRSTISLLPSLVNGQVQVLREAMAYLELVDPAEFLTSLPGVLDGEQQAFVLLHMREIMTFEGDASPVEAAFFERIRAGFAGDQGTLTEGIASLDAKNAWDCLGEFVPRQESGTLRLTPQLVLASAMLRAMVADGVTDPRQIEYFQVALSRFLGLQAQAMQWARLVNTAQFLKRIQGLLTADQAMCVLCQTAHLILLEGDGSASKWAVFHQTRVALGVDERQITPHLENLRFLNSRLISASSRQQKSLALGRRESRFSVDRMAAQHRLRKANEVKVADTSVNPSHTLVDSTDTIEHNVQQVASSAAASNLQPVSKDKSDPNVQQVSTDRSGSNLQQVSTNKTGTNLQQVAVERSGRNRQQVPTDQLVPHLESVSNHATRPNLQQTSSSADHRNRQPLKDDAFDVNRQQLESHSPMQTNHRLKLGVDEHQKNRQRITNSAGLQHQEQVGMSQESTHRERLPQLDGMPDFQADGENNARDESQVPRHLREDAILNRWMESWKRALENESEVFKRKAGACQQIPPMVNRQRIVDFSGLNIYVEYGDEQFQQPGRTARKVYSYRLQSCLTVLKQHIEGVNQKLGQVEASRRQSA